MDARARTKTFAHLEKVQRGFCGECGTPLTYEYLEAEYIDLAICAFDDPATIPPEKQLAEEHRIPWCEGSRKPAGAQPEQQKAKYAPIMAANRSFQHPDHDTTDWKPRS